MMPPTSPGLMHLRVFLRNHGEGSRPGGPSLARRRRPVVTARGDGGRVKDGRGPVRRTAQRP
jgi:hypothetical protein